MSQSWLFKICLWIFIFRSLTLHFPGSSIKFLHSYQFRISTYIRSGSPSDMPSEAAPLYQENEEWLYVAAWLRLVLLSSGFLDAWGALSISGDTSATLGNERLWSRDCLKAVEVGAETRHGWRERRSLRVRVFGRFQDSRLTVPQSLAPPSMLYWARDSCMTLMP